MTTKSIERERRSLRKRQAEAEKAFTTHIQGARQCAQALLSARGSDPTYATLAALITTAGDAIDAFKDRARDIEAREDKLDARQAELDAREAVLNARAVPMPAVHPDPAAAPTRDLDVFIDAVASGAPVRFTPHMPGSRRADRPVTIRPQSEGLDWLRFSDAVSEPDHMSRLVLTDTQTRADAVTIAARSKRFRDIGPALRQGDRIVLEGPNPLLGKPGLAVDVLQFRTHAASSAASGLQTITEWRGPDGVVRREPFSVRRRDLSAPYVRAAGAGVLPMPGSVCAYGEHPDGDRSLGTLERASYGYAFPLDFWSTEHRYHRSPPAPSSRVAFWAGGVKLNARQRRTAILQAARLVSRGDDRCGSLWLLQPELEVDAGFSMTGWSEEFDRPPFEWVNASETDPADEVAGEWPGGDVSGPEGAA